MKLNSTQRQLVDLLCEHAPIALLVNLLLPILACIPLVHEVPASVLLFWCGAVAAVALARFFLLWSYQDFGFSDGEEKYSKWGYTYLGCTVLQGMAWGIGAVVLLSYTTGFNQTLVLLLIAGIGAGAIPLLGALLSAYTAFLLPTTVPVIIWMLSEGVTHYWVLAGIGSVFTWVCFLGAKRFNDILTKTISTGVKAELVDELNITNEELEDSIKVQQQVEKELRDRAKLEQVITTLSAGFVRLSCDEIENGVDRALAKLGSFAQADRCYIYLFGEEDGGSVVHQWYTPEAGARDDTDFSQLKYTMSLVKRSRTFGVESISQIPVEATAEQEMFKRNKLKSWYCVPLVMDGETRGFLSFDALENEVKLSDEVIGLLRVAGTTLVNALERKRVEGLMQHQAYHDPLTSLPNRRLFMEHIDRTYEECRRRKGKAAVLFLDIDYFKTVNDTLGHDSGDVLLKEIATRLKEGLRGQDIASRLGGDEFVVLLTDVSQDSVDPTQSTLSLAQRVQSILSEPYFINGQTIKVTVSMGVALFPARDTTAANVITHADAAMYKAKKTGRNAIQFFERDTQRKARMHLKTQEDLRDALEQNQFIFFAQSQVNSHRDIVTEELLLRWKSPQGVVKPSDFIHLAEDTGLITEIDDWVLNAACETIRQQKAIDHEQNITYAINVSTTQFQKKGFEANVAKALESAGLNGGFLELEVTEELFKKDQEVMARRMRRLKSLGVRIAVDDFGIGYSSLAFLKHLPIDKIKIDRSFVQGIEKDSENTAIVEAMLSIAQHFELEVVAEGVENNVQLEFLKSHGVGLFQGHLFGEPRPIEFNEPIHYTAAVGDYVLA